jgi:hypothetical protein
MVDGNKEVTLLGISRGVTLANRGLVTCLRCKASCSGGEFWTAEASEHVDSMVMRQNGERRACRQILFLVKLASLSQE